MITFLMAFRAYSSKNIEGMKKMLSSIETCIPNFELLIKLDTDDIKGIEFINRENKNYIKSFIYNRWEGRWTINYFYDYLFLHRDLRSKYIVMITDDIIITRNFLHELDGSYILGNFQSAMTREKLDKVGDLFKKQGLTSEYICSYPIVSTKLIEVIGNFGYQANPDSHLALLNIIMYQKYGIILAKHIKDFTKRDNIDRLDNYGIDFNKENKVSDSEMLQNSYILKLIEQQAKNIYLNGEKYD